MVSIGVPEFAVGGRLVGPAHPPLVIPEIGINHGGSIERARRMVLDAAESGAEVVKFQSHIPAAEMIRNDIVPANASVSIWDIVSGCTLSADEERELKDLSESLGLTFLSTPFSREAATRLAALGVDAFKIGSGECNNLPLLDHVASFGKPVILSTGMNDLESVARSVDVLRRREVSFALLHCTSVYPTNPKQVRLGAIEELRREFPDAVVGYSDHTLDNHVAFAAIALGASIVERHFVSDLSWPGPDVAISMGPAELADLVSGAAAIHRALGGHKSVLAEEQPTIDFAFASVVTTSPVVRGQRFTEANTWVKRPGTGEIPAGDLGAVLGGRATRDLAADQQVRLRDVEHDAG